MSSKGRVGIDVAYPEEFAAGYPFDRAFRPEELDSARALCHNDTARGAALIWSAKEASVKATGAGFSRFDPLDVRVEAPHFSEQGIRFEVLADRPICAWARTEGRGWLCVALASQKITPDRNYRISEHHYGKRYRIKRNTASLFRSFPFILKNIT